MDVVAAAAVALTQSFTVIHLSVSLEIALVVELLVAVAVAEPVTSAALVAAVAAVELVDSADCLVTVDCYCQHSQLVSRFLWQLVEVQKPTSTNQ